MNYFFELWLSLIYSLNYSETYFELDSEEATHCDHCHLICCVYIKGHVKMVDTKDQSNAIVYFVCYVVCQHCQHEDQRMQCIECYVCQYCQHWCLWLLHNTVYRAMRCENYSTLYKVALSCIDSIYIYSIDGMVENL